MNKLHKLLIIALLLIVGGNTLKAENLTATRNSDTELVTKNQDLHSHDNLITNDNHVTSMLTASAAAEDLTVTIHTGAEVTLKDTDGDGFYDIGTADELYAFAEAVNGGEKFINGELTANITVNEKLLNADGSLNGTSALAWEPIGSGDVYYGVFDGNGYTVSGIYMNNESNFQGLFAYVYGTVRNVGVEDSYIKGASYVGGVAGYSGGTVKNCFFDGTVIGTGSVGGICGHLMTDAVLNSCLSIGSVSGTGDVGGVVGCAEVYSTNCYFLRTEALNVGLYGIGAIILEENFFMGVPSDQGAAPLSSGELATGDVTFLLNDGDGESEDVWGQIISGESADPYPVFVNGSNRLYRTVACDTDSKIYTNDPEAVSEHAFGERGICVSCGSYQPAVDSDGDGYYEISNAGHLYWFAKQVNENVEEFRTANAILTKDIDFGQSFTFIPETGLVEVRIDGEVVAYLGTFIPGTTQFTGVPNSGVGGGSGGKEEEKEENTELTETTDIISMFGSVYLYVDGKYVDTPNGYVVEGLLPWTPIALHDSGYGGIFDGNGKSIIGLYYNGDDRQYHGVFGVVDGGTVKDLGVENGYFSGNNDYYFYCGAIAGYVLDGTVSGCFNTGLVLKGAYNISDVGGLIGVAEQSVISDCYNTGVVRGEFQIGGIVGLSAYTVVADCYNLGTVIGGENVGGIVGKNLHGSSVNSLPMITGCYNKGEIIGTTYVGGIAGYNTQNSSDAPYTIISGCYNEGEITGTTYVGGILGYNYNGNISAEHPIVIIDSYNVGAVTGVYSVGGILGVYNWVGAGDNGNGKIVSSHNYGAVSGDTNVGGILGGYLEHAPILENNYFYGSEEVNKELCGIGSDGSSDNATPVSAEDYASGKIAYLLGEGWGQLLTGENADAYPVFATDGNKVYRYYDCYTATEKYTNDSSLSDTVVSHTIVEGICSVCNVYNPDDIVDGVYQIGTKEQLFWFANHVNTADRTASAVLVADIDLENIPWTPIGSTGENSNNFRGVFDGQNHTITGLYVEGGRAGLGFFGEVRTGTVKNFTIYGEVVVNTEVNYVGGVIGSACGLNGSDHGLEHNGATIQNITSYVNLTAKTHGIGMVGGFIGYANHQSVIENCSWYGTFDAGEYRVDSGAGGFIGRLYDTSDVTVRNCAAYGTIKTAYKSGTFENYSTIYIGGFLSFSPSGAKTVLENNLWAGEIIDNTDLDEANAHLSAYGTMTSFQSITNCYALSSTPYVTTNNENDNAITTVTAERLASGEIAYLLQGEQKTQVWGQNIDNGEMADAYPVLGGAKVYEHTFDFENINVYSNLETFDMTPHGKCGDKLYWNITDNTLTIFGTGAMYDYKLGASPWYTHKESLKTLLLEEGMTYIGKRAFRDCSGFTGDLIIPNSVTSIGDYAFYECSGFTGSLIIPNRVTSIGNHTFDCCSGFTGDLIIPNSVTSIGRSAFYECSGFTGDLIIPNRVTSIGNHTFYGCSGFTGDLIIPNSVTSIGESAFANCSGFTGSLTIGNSVTSIGRTAFHWCDGFTGSLIIPNSVTSIGSSAFEGCSGFTGDLIIGNSVTAIYNSAFYGCSGFTEVFFYRNECPYIDFFSFYNVKAKIHVPVIWESFTDIPSDKLVKMPTFVGQQTTDNGQQTSSTGWVFPEGQTEISAEDHVAINAPLVLGQQTTDNSQQTLSTLTVKSFGYCGDGTTINGSITIEEGGQLYCETARGEVTVRKEIIGYAGQQTTDNGQQTSWYTIASPLKEVIDLSNSNTFITSTPFDLYRYDEPSHTWQNAKPGEGSTNFQTIETGRGYLYANAENTTLEFTGNINTEDVNYTLTAQSEVLNGFHLVGNPYTHDISFNHLSADAELANGYYVLNGEGAWGATLGNEGDVIKVGQGALIKTIDAGTLMISKSQSRNDTESQSRDASMNPAKSTNIDTSQQPTISLIVSNSTYSDKAFVVFDKGVGLDKINHENENIPLLYIPQGDTDYAIAMMDENVIEIPVSFEAMTMGQYTISLQQENCDFNELYLLDKETGEKMNILEESYTFMATTYDSAERFVLLKDNGQQTTDNSHFAYQSGSDLIINAEGTVQIIDMMGRIIYSNDVTSDNSRINVSGFTNAAYLIRLVNENGVKVQKVVIY